MLCLTLPVDRSSKHLRPMLPLLSATRLTRLHRLNIHRCNIVAESIGHGHSVERVSEDELTVAWGEETSVKMSQVDGAGPSSKEGGRSGAAVADEDAE